MAVAPEELADAMFDLVSEYQGRKKFKPIELTQMMIQNFGDAECDKRLCKAAIRILMDSGRCVYTYFGGTYIEVPHREGAAEDAPEQAV